MQRQQDSGSDSGSDDNASNVLQSHDDGDDEYKPPSTHRNPLRPSGSVGPAAGRQFGAEGAVNPAAFSAANFALLQQHMAATATSNTADADESEEGLDTGLDGSGGPERKYTGRRDATQRKQHNHAERKRRAVMQQKFDELREVLPGSYSTNRVNILTKAREHVIATTRLCEQLQHTNVALAQENSKLQHEVIRLQMGVRQLMTHGQPQAQQQQQHQQQHQQHQQQHQQQHLQHQQGQPSQQPHPQSQLPQTPQQHPPPHPSLAPHAHGMPPLGADYLFYTPRDDQDEQTL